MYNVPGPYEDGLWDYLDDKEYRFAFTLKGFEEYACPHVIDDLELLGFHFYTIDTEDFDGAHVGKSKCQLMFKENYLVGTERIPF